MTQALRKPQRLSEAEYLDLETVSDSRHELVDGVIHAMVGADRSAWNYRPQSRVGAFQSSP